MGAAVDAELEMPGTEAPEVKPAEELTSHLVDSLLHDARNPLNAISIHLEVLGGKLRDDDGQIPANVQKNLKAIREQVTRLDGMLRQFGAFLAPRPEASAPVELGALVQGAGEVMGHVARSRGLTLSLSIETSVLLSPRDPSAVRRCVLEVLAAGIRAAPPGQVLSVRVSRGDGMACLVLEPQDLKGGTLAWEVPGAQPWARVQELASSLDAAVRQQGAARALLLPMA